MKFTCPQPLLSKALNTVSKAVSARTTIPILKGILLKVNSEGKVSFTASDLDLSIEKTFMSEVFEEGSVVVSAKLFGDIIRKLPAEEVEVEAEDNQVSIRCLASEFKIVGKEADEFPGMGDEGLGDPVLLEKEFFKEMIKKTAFAASQEESKGIIVGVLTEMDEEGLTMVALDGFRMAVCREKSPGHREKSIIVSARIMQEIAKLLSETDEEAISLCLEEKKAVIILEDTKVVLRLLEGDFIRYKDILPSEFSTVVTAERQELLNCIERASLLAREGKNNLIKLSITDGKMIITSRSEEGNVKEEAFIQKDGEDLDIGFNSKYILDALKAVTDEEVKIGFNSAISPCLVQPLEGNAFRYLILPVRIAIN